jgi:hypothetical protein
VTVEDLITRLEQYPSQSEVWVHTAWDVFPLGAVDRDGDGDVGVAAERNHIQ